MGQKPSVFRRADGVEGVGFFVKYAGLDMISVAWPDDVCRRYTVEEMRHHKIEHREIETHHDSAPDVPSAINEGVAGLEKQLAETTVDRDNTVNLLEKMKSENEALKSQIEHLTELPAGEGDLAEALDEGAGEGEAVQEGSEEKQKSEAQHIRDYLSENPGASNAQVIEHLQTIGVTVTSSQIATQRKKLKKKRLNPLRKLIHRHLLRKRMVFPRSLPLPLKTWCNAGVSLVQKPEYA